MTGSEPSPLFFSRDYFLTDIDGERRMFSSTIRATEDTIEDLIAKRGGFEKRNPRNPCPTNRPQSTPSLADMIEAEGFTPDTIHYACYVGFLALKCGSASIEDILGDCGLIHEMSHNMAFGEGEACIADRNQVVRMARKIEQAIPGYPYA